MLDFNTTLIIQIINFLVLVVLLRVFAYKPIVQILKDRRAKIEASILSVENDENKAKALVEEYRAKLNEARQQAQEIMSKAEKQAEDYKDEQIEIVKKEIAQMKKNAEEDILRQKEKAVVQMREEVVKLSIEAAALIIAKNMDKESSEDLVNDFINKLDKDKLGDMPC